MSHSQFPVAFEQIDFVAQHSFVVYIQVFYKTVIHTYSLLPLKMEARKWEIEKLPPLLFL